MTGAALLSLDEFRDAPRRTEVQQRLHHRFDRWRQRVEDHVQESQPTLAELTQAVLALRQEWTQAVPEGVGEPAHRATVEQRTAVGTGARPLDGGVARSARLPVRPHRGGPDRP
jgi:hypothetical protein